MARITELLGKSTIASSDAVGGGLVGTPVGAANNMIGIKCPVLNPETCWLEALVGDEWRRVQVYGLDVALTENRFVIVDGVPCQALRAASDTPVTGDREFEFWRILDI